MGTKTFIASESFVLNNIEDVLTSTATDKSLSAAKGKELNDKIPSSVEDLGNTSMTDIADGDLLSWDNANSQWINKSPEEASTDDEAVRDIIGTAMDAGTNITVTVDDDNDKITIGTDLVDLTVDGAGTVHANNYTDTTYSVGDGGLTEINFTTDRKDKLEAIEAEANKYVHPDTAGAKHIPAGGSVDQILVYDSDGVAVWADPVTDEEVVRDTIGTALVGGTNVTITIDDDNDTITVVNDLADLTIDGAGTVHANNYTDTTYADATTDVAGLMSTAHFDKVEGVEAEANKYVHPDAKHIPADGAADQILAFDSAGTAKWIDPAATGEDNVQVDWTETDDTLDSYIKNKPTDLVVDADLGVTVQEYDADTTKNDIANTFTAAQRGTITALADDTVALDFRTTNSYSVTLTADADITLGTDGTLGCAGQGGMLTVTTAEHITGWGTEFKWKNEPTDLADVERFSYFIEAEDTIAIGVVR